jgi:hypothetical protein
VECGDGPAQAVEIRIGGGFRQHPLDEVQRGLQERAGGLTRRGVARDRAACRVRGLAVDAGRPKRGPVDPSRVAVVGTEEDRPDRLDRVELVRRGHPAGDGRVDPAVPHEPRRVRVGGGPGADTRREVVEVRGAREVDLVEAPRAPEQVDMGIVEPRQHEAAAGVDEFRGRTSPRSCFAVGAQPRNPAVRHRDRTGRPDGR